MTRPASSCAFHSACAAATARQQLAGAHCSLNRQHPLQVLLRRLASQWRDRRGAASLCHESGSLRFAPLSMMKGVKSPSVDAALLMVNTASAR